MSIDKGYVVCHGIGSYSVSVYKGHMVCHKIWGI